MILVMTATNSSDKASVGLLLRRESSSDNTFDWLQLRRQVSKEYERIPQTSETFAYLSMLKLISRLLA